MSNELVSRQAMASSAPVAMQARDDAMMIKAKMIANSGYMVPKHYRNNPGACLLAVDWADRFDVAILETLAHVAFIGGKPTIEVVLQKRLAKRSGFSTRVIETTDDYATVACVGPDGEETGRYTYTWQLAQDLGIHWDNKNNKMKDSWKADRAHMLVKRATARALEYYGDENLATVAGDSAVDDLLDDLESVPPLDAVIVDEPAQETPQGVADGTDAPIRVPTADELRAALKAAGIRQATALKAAREMYADADFGTFDDIAVHPDAAIDLADWIEQQ